jgi:hypothetical protein
MHVRLGAPQVDELPQPVKGRSAYSWSGAGIWLTTTWTALGFVTAGVRLFGPSKADATFFIFFWAWILYMCIAFPLIFFSRSRINAEIAAGYSTLPFEKHAVVIVDAKTGLRLREPTDPALRSRDDLRRARERASEIALAQTSGSSKHQDSK